MDLWRSGVIMDSGVRHDHVVDVKCLARTYDLCYHSNDLQALYADLVERRKSVDKNTALRELDRVIKLLQQLVSQP